MIKFDPTKVKIVPIEEVRPNSWNPKVKQTDEYKRIKRGIELKGLRLPITVRENDGYEIIDGEQRYTACKELGFKTVIIYNEGIVSDKEAKELTIWFQQQVPFDEIELAGVIKSLALEHKDLELPYTDIEIEEYTKLSDFDFNQYNSERPEIDEAKKKVTCPNCGHEF